jgi:CheY-like chemotaxis protein
MRLFLADDMPAVRELLRRCLSGAGVEVVGEAGSGPEALEQIEALRPDLVILDVVMPGMSGLDVVNSLRSRGIAAPVILCTAEDEVADPLPPGVLGCLRKPLQLDRLVELVAAAALPPTSA